MSVVTVPGRYEVVRGGASDALVARRAGYEVRDAVLVVGPEGVGIAWLFRAPPGGTVVESLLVHGVGGLPGGVGWDAHDGGAGGARPTYAGEPTRWACEPGCLVARLDDVAKPPMDDMGYGGTGGASRFYPQLQGETGAEGWLARLVGGGS